MEQLKQMAYLRGGMVRFAAGLRPFNIALRECIMKCSVGDIEATVATKLSGNKPLSDSCIDQKFQGCMQGQQNFLADVYIILELARLQHPTCWLHNVVPPISNFIIIISICSKPSQSWQYSEKTRFMYKWSSLHLILNKKKTITTSLEHQAICMTLFT